MLNLYLFQILNGLGLGMIYFLIAVGLTIIFGLLNFVNFAHGAFFLLGAYICYTAVSLTGNFWLALLIAPLVVAALAWVIERLLIQRIYHLPHMFQILVTLGIALIIQEASVMIWGPVGKSVAVPELLRGVLVVGDFVYPTTACSSSCFPRWWAWACGCCWSARASVPWCAPAVKAPKPCRCWAPIFSACSP